MHNHQPNLDQKILLNFEKGTKFYHFRDGLTLNVYSNSSSNHQPNNLQLFTPDSFPKQVDH